VLEWWCGAAGPSVWAELEGDTLGYIVEAADLTDRIAVMLRLAAELVPPDSDVALAASLGPTDQIVEGRVSDLGRRTQATLGSSFGRQALNRILRHPRKSLRSHPASAHHDPATAVRPRSA
jgi:hypothetical protein